MALCVNHPVMARRRRRAIVESYVRVFAPALAFSATQLGLTLAAFFSILLALGISGRGFADVENLAAGLPLLPGLLDKVDPSWGNAAIALVLVEVLAPFLLPVAVAASPPVATALQAKLESWGLDADGLNARIEKVLEDTS